MLQKLLAVTLSLLCLGSASAQQCAMNTAEGPAFIYLLFSEEAAFKQGHVAILVSNISDNEQRNTFFSIGGRESSGLGRQKENEKEYKSCGYNRSCDPLKLFRTDGYNHIFVKRFTGKESEVHQWINEADSRKYHLLHKNCGHAAVDIFNKATGLSLSHHTIPNRTLEDIQNSLAGYGFHKIR